MAIPIEHERRFLVVGNDWRRDAVPSLIRQGYLDSGGHLSVRVRRRGDQAFLTLKSKSRGTSRVEFEYPIPAEHADYLLNWGCDRLPIDKVRFEVTWGGRLWEIDVFKGANRGLVLAEIELDGPDEPVELPPWVGREVTGDVRYSNSHLYLHPYRSWAVADPAEELVRV